MQTLPLTIEQFHYLKTHYSLTERFSISSTGEIYSYFDKVKDFYKKSDDRRLLAFHRSIKDYPVYDEFGEARDLDLSEKLDLVLIYPSSPRIVPYVCLKFYGKYPDNREYFQFVLLQFLTDATEESDDLVGQAQAIFWAGPYGAIPQP